MQHYVIEIGSGTKMKAWCVIKLATINIASLMEFKATAVIRPVWDFHGEKQARRDSRSM